MYNLLLSLLTLTRLHGTLFLDGRSLDINLDPTSRIDIGYRAFKLHDFSKDVLSGTRIAVTNGKITANQSVDILLNAEVISEIRNDPSILKSRYKEFTEAALAEVHCEESSNTFIAITDNLSEPYPVVGNCTRLETQD